MALNTKKDFDTRNKPQLNTLVYGRIPPQLPDVEEAVLGCILLEKNAADTVIRILREPECFYVDANQKIYAAILRLVNKGQPIDMLTVIEELRAAGEFEIVGGAAYLVKLTSSVVSGAHAETHSMLIMQKFMMRELIRISGETIAKAYEDSEDVFDLMEATQTAMSGINDHIRTGTIKSLAGSILPTIMEMREARNNNTNMLGLKTGLTKLDEITLGLTAPDLIVLAAGTGEGKTSLALNIAESIARSGSPVGFFSLEMKDKQLVWKILSRILEEEIKVVRGGKFSDAKWTELEGTILNEVRQIPLYIYDKGGINIIELKATARTMKKKYGIQALFIDYIQLVRGAGKKFGTREEEVNFVSKELKGLAMDLEIPIIALSQLNRMEKGKAARLYALSDLRESGAIEQDADGVIFVFRPSQHKCPEMNIGGTDMTFDDTDAIIDIAKWRLGEVGAFRAKFVKQHNQFTDYQKEIDWQHQNPQAGIRRDITESNKQEQNAPF